MAKTIKELSFDNLYVVYKTLGKLLGKDQALQQFTTTFNELIVQCADTLYNGNVDDIGLHKALYNNLVADKRTRFTNPDRYGYVSELSVKLEFVGLLDTLLPVEKRSVPKKQADANLPDKAAKWQYTIEDVQGIKDVDTLKKFISSIGTAKARSVEKAMAEFNLTSDEVIARFDALRDEARKQIALLEATVLSDTLASKLQAGKKTTLSAKEVEELLALINKAK